jgi:hypothetical protein
LVFGAALAVVPQLKASAFDTAKLAIVIATSAATSSSPMCRILRRY